MKIARKISAFALSFWLLFSLCLPQVGFATETLPEEPSVEQTVATAEELIAWLEAHADEPGSVKLTADITLEDFIYYKFSDAPVVVDTGEFSLIIKGEVELLCMDLTIRGEGGERGVLRVAEGGTLSIDYLTVEARAGLALVQEEGSGFVGAPCLAPESAAQFATKPYVWLFHSALALVAQGAEAPGALPATLRGYVNQNGAKQSYEDIPVEWSLEGSEAAQAERLRFTSSGQCSGYAYAAAPQCTVVYDGGPLTFTKAKAQEASRSYTVIVGFTKPEQLPITVIQEYSFDREKWLYYWDADVDLVDMDLAYVLGKGPGEESWDTATDPYLYVRLRWEDGETEYYSNVLRFSAENLSEVEDIGGNRGGGIDFPETTPPPEDGNDSDPDPEPEPTPPPYRPVPRPTPSKSPELTPVPTPTATASEPPVLTPEPTPTAELPPEPTPSVEPGVEPTSEPAPSPVDEPSASPMPSRTAKPVLAVESDAEPTDTPEPTPSVTPASDVGPEPVPTIQPEPSEVPMAVSAPEEPVTEREAPRGPGIAAIAAGLGTVAVAMGGATLWLNPKLRGKLFKKK